MKQSFRNHIRSVTMVVLLWCIPQANVKGQEKGDQKFFATPEAAVDAMLDAFKNNDEQALLNIFGHQHQKLIVVSDKIERAQNLMELYEAAQIKRLLQSKDPTTRTLVLGDKDWPFPIPIIKETAGWRFDTDSGAEEILNRRIGEHELEALATCRAYVAAQIDYAWRDRDGDRVREYAQRLGSTSGAKDGLYWPADVTAGEEPSPFGPLLADAAPYLAARKKSQHPLPFQGYFYKILTRQGKNVPGGKYDYIINGNMIAGFALVAWPADYDSSGIMSFVVSHHGRVYEKDLGDKTADIVKKMNEFNPDDTWTTVEEE